MNMTNQQPKPGVFASACKWLKRLFIRKERLSALDEEALQTPFKTIVKNYFHNRLGVIGLIVFIACLLFSFVGSQYAPSTFTYFELTNGNLRPSTNYLNFPKDLDGNRIVKIASGISFSYALMDDGQLVSWGTEPNIRQENVSDYVLTVPEEVRNKRIVDITTGGRHVLALDDEGVLHGWGYYGHGQTVLPHDIRRELETTGASIEQIYATTMWSAIVTSDKNLHIWGSQQTIQNFKLTRAMRGHVEKVAAGDNNMLLLLDDGTVAVIGDRSSEFHGNVPKELTEGSIQVVDIVACNRNALVLDTNGDIYTWGSTMDGLTRVPPFDQDVRMIEAGYKHFSALLADGSVVAWGANQLRQLDVPEDMPSLQIIHSDYFQNYGIAEDGSIHAWGNRGYILGSDEFGRDMLHRLIHGGRISLTVGAIAVVIELVIALFVGLSSGFFGGWVDHLLMRVTDVFESIPFLPIAITLSYAVGNLLSDSERLYLIMVVLGILSWMGLARMIRAQLLVEREKDFVLAARALGIRKRKIMWRHILPNVFNLVVVNVTLGYASLLLYEAILSFLGFGVAQPTPSWGNMLTSAQNSAVIQYYWWRWFIPGLFVVLAALSINLVGDALREAMDPRGNER